ncbi:amino acid ABC transporter permease [Salinibacterium sp. UTAS2018]|uniref:amino acid ABC transporter permease n=1 Tax=unclassified Salinibacterium TaxID=2632331 RepID=UPI0010096B09|nr:MULTISPECIES: amino acid ABC transporter permease [unclassified Salinibacterium]MBH0007860.1 amino acid ABC transporter permease [Salinibacterium sp. SWN1162]QAV70794.1 amino acid ABC transporter permease [Salinibacterium sp. UTAS2018]
MGTKETVEREPERGPLTTQLQLGILPSGKKVKAARSGRSTLSTIGGWALRIFVVLVILEIISKFLTADAMRWDVVWSYLFSEKVISGVGLTLFLTVVAMVLGCVIGLLLALMKISNSLLLNVTADGYIWLFRGTPLLVQLLFWYNLASFLPTLSFGIPFGPQFLEVETNSVVTAMVAAMLGLGLNEGAYMSEIFRAGIQSVDHGQTEAAAALGMSRRRAMNRIVLPQAMRVIVPPTGNQVISMLKGTSLVSIVAISELLYTVQVIYARTFETIPLLVVACIWYLFLTTVLSIGQHYIEKHYAKGANRNVPDSYLTKFKNLFGPSARQEFATQEPVR